MLDAALAVFSRSGFHAASMDEIARRAGVSKPMLYLYLGSKEDLFTACLRREGARLVEGIVAAVAPWRSDPPDARLRNGLRAFFGFVAAHRDGWAVLYRQARAEQPFAAEITAMRARMVQVLTGLLGGDGGPGDGGPGDGGPGDGGVDPGLLALILVGAAESVADRLADQPGADPDRAATHVMTIMWPGIRDALPGAAGPVSPPRHLSSPPPGPARHPDRPAG